MSTDLASYAYKIISLVEENDDLRQEVAELRRYKEMYLALLNESEQHGRAMMGSILNMLVTPGVGEALVAAGKKEDKG